MFNKLSSIVSKLVETQGHSDWLERDLNTKFRKGRGSNTVIMTQLAILIEMLEELKEIKAAIRGDNVKVEVEVDSDVITETVEAEKEEKEVDDKITEDEEEESVESKSQIKRINIQKKGKKK